MTYTKKIGCWLLAFVFCASALSAQELTTEEAAMIALENNYGIKIAENNVEAARNNASIYNSGYLPTLSSTVNGTYNVSDINSQFQNGNEVNLAGAESNRYSASVDLDYVLFDGLGRMYDYRSLKETYNLSELEARATIENTLLQLFDNYYEVARLTQNAENLKASLEISKNQLLRSQYQFQFGQANRLDVLNAEVNVNNDSISLINTRQSLSNAKRDLNLVLGRSITQQFEVDTLVTFLPPFSMEEAKERALRNNVQLLLAEKGLEISDYQIKANRSGYVPRVILNGSYGWNKNNNNPASFLLSARTVGFTGGVTLSWNVFDGGFTKTAVQNARIQKDILEIQKQLLLQELERDLINAYTDYQNKLYVLAAEEKNVETNLLNFSRSQERFKVGQITSIDFRFAQQNLLNALDNRNQARYDAKIAELVVIQISGELLNIPF